MKYIFTVLLIFLGVFFCDVGGINKVRMSFNILGDPRPQYPVTLHQLSGHAGFFGWSVGGGGGW